MRAHRLATSLALAVLAAALASTGCSKDIPTQEDLTPSSPTGADANAGTWRMIVLTGPDADRRPRALARVFRGVPGGARRDQVGAGDDHRRPAPGDRLLGRRRRPALEPGDARAGRALQPAARAAGRTAPTPPRTPTTPSPTRVPLRQPAVRRARLQLRQRGPVRGPEGRLALQVPLQPPGAVAGGRRRRRPCCRRAACPSYPSEDAVLSGVSTEVLRLLFPAAVEEITRKAAEQREAALLGGRATASDIAAGLALGRAVAARARRPRRHGRDGGGRRHAGAVAGPRGRRRGARGDPLEEPGVARPAADAPELRQGARVDDDPDRRRERAPGRAARRPPRPRWRRSSPRSSAPRRS